MYHRELESVPGNKARYDEAMRSIAKDRLAKVSAKRAAARRERKQRVKDIEFVQE